MHGIEWLGGADAAFDAARASKRHVLLYWGAAWCPPCNRTKASVFADPRFGQMAARFVPLHVDGDAAGAQQLAERLALRSYPTLVVYRPDGTEVTRLPCELSAERFFAMLELALATPLTAAQALALPASDDAWRLLAWYSWDTDEQQLLKGQDLYATLERLARACPVPDAAQRLQWHALQAAAAGKRDIDQASAIEAIERLLADRQVLLAHADVVCNYGVELVRSLSVPGPGRVQLATAFATALAVLESDASQSLADQMAALRNRVRMARLGAPIAGLEQHARARVAAAMAQDVDAATGHVLLNTCAGVLSDAGLPDAAEALLKDGLGQSHAPFYFMHNLAAIAKKKGDTQAMLNWYEQAWRGAMGAATRLQWGTSYLLALLENMPGEAARIDRLAAAMHAEFGALPDARYQRNRSQLKRIDAKLGAWTGASEHAAALLRTMRGRLAE